jgi:drug/metabolite transporter (DMT)-like permease
MSRIQADILLLLVALIWGAAFVAQKNALAHVESFTFIASRFWISAILVAPLAWREKRRGGHIDKKHFKNLGLLCIAFCAGVMFQQVGLEKTSVTNAGFLTGLYVLFVPVICRIIYRDKLSKLIFPAALMSVAGVYLLSGGALTAVASGDGLVLMCAVGFAVQVALVGRIMSVLKSPFQVCMLQYVSVASAALLAALVFEHPDIHEIIKAGVPILYAGAISGGIAYTLQVVAQQYTPASDSAVIMSGESVFAALSGAIINGERLSPAGATGCALIILAILIVEFGPYLAAKKRGS